MMKATAWFCPVLLTLLSATRLVCTAQRGAPATAAGAAGGGSANGFPLDYLDVQAVQDEYSLAKRNKPSLSIVNPLDVLRQRLLLEIARRQMKENTRQVELNRAILKNVGKRVFLEPAPWGSMRHKLLQQQQQQQQVQLEREREREQLRREQLQQQHFPSQLWGYSGNPAGSSDPSTASAASRFFDFLHRPAKEQQQQLLLDKSLKEGVAKHHQSNGNEIANDTNHENGHRKSATDLMSTEDELDNSGEDRDEMLYEPNMNWASEQHMDDMDRSLEAANGNSRMPWRLIYRMHKASHYAN
ncbi:uncharacterized protein LOC6572523 [Drosophila mojavensis]|uniref:Corticotropin-releasing factor domain-containing protein n=1 Tax=Drosophila mojavensis TaxID=7230 RepID=B4K641_DROMO|nr:uncharacterized protein LOC6572523 [Drosophila mojavensis]XP_032589410.1 uncharacterized protein LOC6572523 [Drosophila mojavensis]EDW14091.1 uncharacterized protein Dmoj_GI24078 [Drosophila mojavensis]